MSQDKLQFFSSYASFVIFAEYSKCFLQFILGVSVAYFLVHQVAKLGKFDESRTVHINLGKEIEIKCGRK